MLDFLGFVAAEHRALLIGLACSIPALLFGMAVERTAGPLNDTIDNLQLELTREREYSAMLKDLYGVVDQRPQERSTDG